MIGEMDLLPFERHAPSRSDSRMLFVCDHASNALPPRYGSLGLEPNLFATHIASDIGAAEVTRRLASEFGAAAILARWSRLLIDLNRGADDPTLVMKLSDGSIVPGNARITSGEVESRIESFFTPYHRAIATEIASMRAGGLVPVIFSIHSFTPV